MVWNQKGGLNMRVRTMTIQEGHMHNIDRYPNFHKSGSISGMKQKVYGMNALLVRCGSYIYNVPSEVYYAAH